MKHIELSKTGKHKGKYFAIVDDEDYEKVIKHKWAISIKNNGNILYARRCITVSTGNRKELPLHRFVLNVKDGYQVDHIDGNGLNNCKSNLRICTFSENMRNKRKCETSFCKFKGVTYYEKEKRYRARITINKKVIHLGRFINEIDAAKEYNKAALLHFGEFAKLNEI